MSSIVFFNLTSTLFVFNYFYPTSTFFVFNYFLSNINIFLSSIILYPTSILFIFNYFFIQYQQLFVFNFFFIQHQQLFVFTYFCIQYQHFFCLHWHSAKSTPQIAWCMTPSCRMLLRTKTGSLSCRPSSPSSRGGCASLSASSSATSAPARVRVSRRPGWCFAVMVMWSGSFYVSRASGQASLI